MMVVGNLRCRVDVAAHAYSARTACQSLHLLKISYVFIRKISNTLLFIKYVMDRPMPIRLQRYEIFPNIHYFF